MQGGYASAQQPLSFAFGHNFSAENPGKIDDFYALEKKALGEGSYGTCYKATAKKGGSGERAIKQIEKKKVKDKTKFDIENSIQKALDHPNIAKLYEYFTDAKYYYLVMELCTGGELFDRIIDAAEASGKDGVAFSEAVAANYMKQILGAMFYMHSNGYVHRDIKPENFLLQSKDKDAEIKVIDFGLAKHNPDKVPMTTKAGTPYYVAPQVLEGKYDDKCDIWSCGVIVYILLCGYPPFYGDRDSDILKMVKKGKFDFPKPDWDNMSKDVQDFITRMLTMDKDKRPSAEELLQDKWLKNAPKEALVLGQGEVGKLKAFTSASRLKKLVLTMISTEMRSEDIADLKTLFKAMDDNGDGMLSREEIQKAMAEIKQKGGYSFDPDQLGTYLEKLDTDGSGKVDWTEFVASMIDKKNWATDDALWRSFRRFDLDGDGQITKDELKQVLVNAKEDAGDNPKLLTEIEAMMKEGDTNGDQQISFDEFKSMMLK